MDRNKSQSRPKENRILIGLAVAFAVLVFVELLLLGNATQQRKAAAWVGHTHEVLENIKELMAQLSDAEAGLRGYMVFGQDLYLAQYTNSVGQVRETMRDVRALTRDNPRQSAACDRLEPLIRQRLAVFTNSLRARQENGFDLAAQTQFMAQGREAREARSTGPRA